MCLRLVEACLGEGSIAQDKLIAGMPLTVLGVDVCITPTGVKFIPEEKKCEKWEHAILSALDGKKRKLHSGEASKLSGGLQWTTQKSFKKLGRAIIRPIFRQIKTKSGDIDAELELSLWWFLEILRMRIAEERPFRRSSEAVCHLFSDARSTPPRIAAVLYQ